MTRADFCTRLTRYTEIASRIENLRMMRARRLCAAAFGNDRPAWDGSAVHNALVAADRGRPWREVNYDLLRAASRAAESRHEPRQIVRAFYDRAVRLCA